MNRQYTTPSRPTRPATALIMTTVVIAILGGLLLEMTRRVQFRRTETQRLAASLQFDLVEEALAREPARSRPEMIALPRDRSLRIVGNILELHTASGETTARRHLSPDDSAPDDSAPDDSTHNQSQRSPESNAATEETTE